MEEKPQLVVESKDPASDEEIARRLQQQLNGEAAAAARRRTRKQPTFYSPQVLLRSTTSCRLPGQIPPPFTWRTHVCFITENLIHRDRSDCAPLAVPILQRPSAEALSPPGAER